MSSSRYPVVGTEVKSLESEFETESEASDFRNLADDWNMSQESITFETLFENLHLISQPNHLWSITCTPKFVICATWDKNYVPEKRVVIESDLSVKVFLKDKELHQLARSVGSIDDVSSLLHDVDSFMICSGADDLSMTTCISYVRVISTVSGRQSIWCKECRILKKRKADYLRKQRYKCRTTQPMVVTIQRSEIENADCFQAKSNGETNIVTNLPTPKQESGQVCIAELRII